MCGVFYSCFIGGKASNDLHPRRCVLGRARAGACVSQERTPMLVVDTGTNLFHVSNTDKI